MTKGEVPGRTSLGFKQPREKPVTPQVPKGTELVWEGIVIEEEAYGEDGTVPAELISTMKNELAYRMVTSKGAISTAGLRQLAELEGLRTLQIFAPDVSETLDLSTLDFSVLSRHNRLRELKISSIDRLTNETLFQLSTLKCIKHLRLGIGASTIDFSGVDDTGIKELSKLKSLRWFHIPHHGKPMSISDAGLAPLGTLPRLQVLHLWSESIDGSGLAALSTCPELHTLHLNSCSVTAAGLKSLVKLKSLSVLDVSGTDIDASFAETASQLNQLRHLELSHSTIADEFFEKWTAPPTLLSLSLDKTAVTDRTIAALVKNPPPNLTTLSLKGDALTDRAISLLANDPPPSLKTLDISYIETISKDAATELQKIKTLEMIMVPKSFDKAAKLSLKAAIPGVSIY